MTAGRRRLKRVRPRSSAVAVYQMCSGPTKAKRMKMYPDDWRVRVTSAVAVAACMGAALLLGPVIGVNGFWPGGLTIIVAIIVGIVLGQLVGRLLFRPSSDRPLK